jgi:Uma2 family endonuclease
MPQGTGVPRGETTTREVTNVALRKREAQPRAEEYPSSDGVPMDNEQHARNIRAWLIEPLQRWCDRRGFTAFLGGNSFVYYGPRRKTDVVGPDFYVVNGGVDRGQASWIVSREGGLKPTLVMEFVSPTSRVHDRTTKMQTYRDRLQVRDYFLVDDGPTVVGYHLHGKDYVPIGKNEHGRLPCASLPLEVGVLGGWVRFFEPSGSVLLTGAEVADAERERADTERARADTERERAEALQREVAALRARLDRSNRGR